MLKICSSLFHGTRSHLNQINKNLQASQVLSNQVKDFIDLTIDERLKALLSKHVTTKSKEESLYSKSIADLRDFDPYVKKMIDILFKHSIVFSSNRALINRKSKFP